MRHSDFVPKSYSLAALNKVADELREPKPEIPRPYSTARPHVWRLRTAAAMTAIGVLVLAGAGWVGSAQGVVWAGIGTLLSAVLLGWAWFAREMDRDYEDRKALGVIKDE